VEEADVLPWRPAPSTLFLGGRPTTTMSLYVGTVKTGLLPVGVAWTVRSLLLLSSCSARKCTELTWMWSLPSPETAHEEVFWSLAVLAVVLLKRRLLMRVFSAGLQSSFHPWAEVGPLKGPRSRWAGIPRYPEHRHLLPPRPQAQPAPPGRLLPHLPPRPARGQPTRRRGRPPSPTPKGGQPPQSRPLPKPRRLPCRRSRGGP
jgi:hypothetical protein